MAVDYYILSAILQKVCGLAEGGISDAVIF